MHIATKKDTKRPGAVLSMGFGFVEFKRQRDAKEAIKQLQGTPACTGVAAHRSTGKTLDEHQLELKMSGKGADASKAERKVCCEALTFGSTNPHTGSPGQGRQGQGDQAARQEHPLRGHQERDPRAVCGLWHRQVGAHAVQV